MLYLPTRDKPDGTPIAEVRRLTDGRAALLAYTALDRLSKHCGAKQQWIVIPTSRIGDVREAQPFDLVAFDVPLPASMLRDGRIA